MKREVRRLPDHDGNPFRNDRWIVGDMILISQYQLQGVGARFEIEHGLRLALSEVDVIFIRWNGLIHGRHLVGVD